MNREEEGKEEGGEGREEEGKEEEEEGRDRRCLDDCC